MKNLKKFEKSEIQNLFSVKGGSTTGSKTSTTTAQTIESQNDSDSNSDIEGSKGGSIWIE